ncbi:phosphoenolpyruvate carboxykinase (ATP) [Spirosoma fluviale]|uniref:Hpr(Ser) kinase/phosphatase n=1 Tax=Spirosoma fluviale TaxID=1597977 RepID=A0A286FFE6_9BACT|nr:serine kinase [Spirosoma fluviale]SOD81975.1 Hpr(Ser) kinase/phosphatase [Spirosoma fluviale]
MKKYLAFGLTLETGLDFTSVLQESTAKTDVRLTEAIIPDKANRPTRVHRRGVQARIGITATSLLLNWPGIAKFKVSGGNEIIYQNLGTDEGTLRLFLLSEAIGLLLYQRGLFLLHGSAVKLGSAASVFVGVPGAGKSTTAAAFGKAGHTVLTDDLVAIQLINKKPFVIPAFAQYKIWRNTVDGLNVDESTLEPSFEGATKFLVTQPLADFPRSPVPLHQITLLYPPNARRTNEPIKPLRAPVELLKHFPLPVQLLTGDFLQTHFRDSLAIAQHAGIYQQKRPNGFDALDLFVQSYSA